MHFEFAPKLCFDTLCTADYKNRDKALISLAMYGRAAAPQFAAIWVAPTIGGPIVAVHPRTFELDWTMSSVAANAAEWRYPKLIGITAWQLEEPRSLLVYEQFAKAQGWPTVAFAEDPRAFTRGFSRGVVTGLDMCVQASAQISDSSPHPQTVAFVERYVAVIQLPPEAPLASTQYNVLRFEPVNDTITGIVDSDQHRAALRGWSRGHHAIPFPRNVSGGRRQVAVHYQDDTFEEWPSDMTKELDCGTQVHGPIKPSQLDARLANAKARERWPMRVGANGFGEHVRFCITWAPMGKLHPLKRHDVVIDGVDPTKRRIGYQTVGSSLVESASASAAPALGGGGSGGVQPVDPEPSGPVFAIGAELHLRAIDKAVFDTMHRNGCHAVQLAVAKDGRLKLVRSYTFGERGYPITNGNSKLRWASIAKMLTAMRAATMDDGFLDHKISQYLPDGIATTASASLIDRVTKYRSTTIADLLRYQSGWSPDRNDGAYSYFRRVYEYGRQLLPLMPGDLKLFVANSNLDFVEEAGGEVEDYNNLDLIATAEAISMARTGAADKYIPVMYKFWRRDHNEDLSKYAIAIPGTVPDCLQAGEPPMRIRPGFGRATLTNKGFPIASGGVAPWAPAGYSMGDDGAFSAGAGYWTMSAAMLVRIMQGLYPSPITPVKKLLNAAQISKMVTPNPNAVRHKDGTPVKGDVGLGLNFMKLDYGGHENTMRLDKDGTLTGGDTQAYHYMWNDRSGEPHHLSAVVATTTGAIPDIFGRIEQLEALGHWDDDTNLFPDFFA